MKKCERSITRVALATHITLVIESRLQVSFVSSKTLSQISRKAVSFPVLESSVPLFGLALYNRSREVLETNLNVSATTLTFFGTIHIFVMAAGCIMTLIWTLVHLC